MPVTEENAVQKFVEKYSDQMTGALSCFDRVLFKGYLPLGWPEAMEALLGRQGRLIKDFKAFVTEQSARFMTWADDLAEKHGRPHLFLRKRMKKEKFVEQMIRRDGLTDGLVCVLRAVETCQSFRVVRGEKRPRLQAETRKCLCYYFYFLDREFGLMHVRIQSWFPLTIQVCVNGHEWLARQMTKRGMTFTKVDNAFVELGDVPAAQKLADKFADLPWPRLLDVFARRVNPLLGDVLKGSGYYWVTDQAEYSTDVMFPNAATLRPLFESWLNRATTCFSTEDVLTFLGRKLHGNFLGEVLTDFKRRAEGARVKHVVAGNWVKMPCHLADRGQGKFQRVLRIETVINRPGEFKVWRRGKRNGVEGMHWLPLCKGVGHLYRYAEIGRATNGRYLNSLSETVDIAKARQPLQKLAEPARRNGRGLRGFNPASKDDVALFAAVLRGEHQLHGFRNEQIRAALYGPLPRDPVSARRQRARVTRLLQRLHAHGLIAKIPRTRRWRPSTKGQTLMTTVLHYHLEHYPTHLLAG